MIRLAHSNGKTLSGKQPANVLNTYCDIVLPHLGHRRCPLDEAGHRIDGHARRREGQGKRQAILSTVIE